MKMRQAGGKRSSAPAWMTSGAWIINFFYINLLDDRVMTPPNASPACHIPHAPASEPHGAALRAAVSMRATGCGCGGTRCRNDPLADKLGLA